jgi:hypothetical protein
MRFSHLLIGGVPPAFGEYGMSFNKKQKQKVIEAAIEFNARQERQSHPEGRFDNGDRWYPSVDERCECCESIRSPSRGYPYSLMLHCRTAEHLANLFQVDVLLLRRAAKALKAGASPQNPDAIPVFDGELKAARKNARPKVRTVWKIVAKVEERYESVFDESEWGMGVTRHETAHSDHGGGFYWYPSLTEAVQAMKTGEVFNEAWCSGKHLVLLECDAWGRVIAYDNGKRASSYLKPVREVRDMGMQI